MPRRKKADSRDQMLESVISAMTDKKACEPVVMDFRQMKGILYDSFVICHGTSSTQVEAIADHVIETVKAHTGINPWHTEGFKNAEWILIDYVDVVVHIFQESRRNFYNLEQLWADAEIMRITVPEHQS